MFPSFFLDDCLTIFNPCIDFTNFNPTAKLAITTETLTNERKAEIKKYSLTAETKERKMLKVIMFYFL